MKPVRVVTTHPIQYQAPLYRYLAARGVPLQVYFLSNAGADPYFDRDFGRTVQWDVPLTDGYDHTFLRNLRSGGGGGMSGYVNPGVLSIADRKRTAAVWVHGYRNLSMLGVIVAARARGVPVLYRAETHTLHRTGRPGIAAGVRGRVFVHAVDATLSIGTANDRFYAELGMRPEARFLVPYAVDNDRMRQAAAELPRSAARAEVGLPRSGRVVLFAGKLVAWKDPQLLLHAFAALARDDPAIHLAFAGTGPLGSGLRELAERVAPGRVRFLGFLNQTELPRAYAAADVLVLPSRNEPWGLVVNEAMNFGCAVVVSDSVGCYPDLVDESTGAVFRTGDEYGLRAALAEVLASTASLRARREGALERISHWGFAECHRGLLAALEAVA